MCPNRCNNNIITTNSFNNNTFTDDDLANDTLSAGNYRMPVEGYNRTMNYGVAYVPNQTFRTVFTPSNGLANGTMFPELVSPYYPNQSLAMMNYLREFNEGGCR